MTSHCRQHLVSSSKKHPIAKHRTDYIFLIPNSWSKSVNQIQSSVSPTNLSRLSCNHNQHTYFHCSLPYRHTASPTMHFGRTLVSLVPVAMIHAHHILPRKPDDVPTDAIDPIHGSSGSTLGTTLVTETVTRNATTTVHVVTTITGTRPRLGASIATTSSAPNAETTSFVAKTPRSTLCDLYSKTVAPSHTNTWD